MAPVPVFERGLWGTEGQKLKEKKKKKGSPPPSNFSFLVVEVISSLFPSNY